MAKGSALRALPCCCTLTKVRNELSKIFENTDSQGRKNEMKDGNPFLTFGRVSDLVKNFENCDLFF